MYVVTQIVVIDIEGVTVLKVYVRLERKVKLSITQHEFLKSVQSCQIKEYYLTDNIE